MSALVLDIGGSRLRGARVRGARVERRADQAWPTTSTASEDLSAAIQMVDALAEGDEPIGVSLAALVDGDGVVRAWPNRPSWTGLAVRRELEERTGRHVVLVDDVHAAALAEWRLGRGRDFESGLYVHVGTGIGGALVLDGVVRRGWNGWSGELGHVVVSPDGPECGCGRRGCVQTLASGRALDEVARHWGLGSAAEVFAAAAYVGWAQNAVQTSARWLGLAIGNAVTLLDVESVVVGGHAAHSPTWWRALEEALVPLNAAHRDLTLARAVLGDDAGLLGAGLAAS